MYGGMTLGKFAQTLLAPMKHLQNSTTQEPLTSILTDEEYLAIWEKSFNQLPYNKEINMDSKLLFGKCTVLLTIVLCI